VVATAEHQLDTRGKQVVEVVLAKLEILTD